MSVAHLGVAKSVLWFINIDGAQEFLWGLLVVDEVALRDDAGIQYFVSVRMQFGGFSKNGQNFKNNSNKSMNSCNMIHSVTHEIHSGFSHLGLLDREIKSPVS